MISLKAGPYPQNNIVFLLRQLFFRLKGTEAPLIKWMRHVLNLFLKNFIGLF